MCIQTCSLTRGTVWIDLLLIKHLDFLRVLHVNSCVIMLRLLLSALSSIISSRVRLRLSTILRLVTHSFGPIKVLWFLLLLRHSTLFIGRLSCDLRILALVHPIVDHGIIISFPLPVLASWGHWHGWKMNSVAIFGLNLWHASFHLLLGIIWRSMARLNIAIIPTAPRWVLFGASGNKLLLFLMLLGRWELTIIINRTSIFTHYAVDVNLTVCVI